MATPSSPSPALRRGQAVRGNANSRASPRRGRRGSVVHFDEVTSIYQTGPEDDSRDSQHLQGTLRREDDYSGPEYEEHGRSKRCCYNVSILLEKPWVTQFFRVCAVLNLLSLVCSSPWKVCERTPTLENGAKEDCEAVFLQFVIIASVDFIVSVVYTIHLLLVIQSLVFQNCCERKSYHHIQEGVADVEVQREGSRGHCMLLMELSAITLSLWYSVAIGIYRSYVVREYTADLPSNVSDPITSTRDPVLTQFFYLAFFFRSFAAVSALQLARFNQRSTALGGLMKTIRHRWKQLLYVSIFYFFNVYIFALIGVQILGGLTSRCFYEDESGRMSLAIPTTHCVSDDDSRVFKSCYNNSDMQCLKNNESGPLNIDYRNTVYLGQFRSIVDALLAVYEASSLELWSFMEYNALSGSSRSTYTPVLFYFMMVFYLVIIVQQSIFLVVIIESFADLRSDAAGEAVGKQQKKPTIVLYEQKGGTNEIGFRDIEAQESLTAFKRKRNKYYYRWVEKGFIILVLVDAAITSATHADMTLTAATALRYWQLVVSIIFLFEVVGLFVFHLVAMPMQLVLFFKNSYFWFLIVIAIGGVAGAGWRVSIPLEAGNFMAVFQALRLIRVLRLFQVMKNFVSSIIGDSVRMLTVVLIVAIFLVWFAVVSMVLVGYLKPEDQCERIGSERFRDFFHSFESMFQLLMQEGWSQLYSEFQCRRDRVWLLINFYFIVLHLISSLFLLNFFVAVILDNLDYDEDEKILKLEEAEKSKEKIQTVPRHLRIFKVGGPKKIPVPKLSSADTPNLTEADVRNFYNVGEVTDLPSDYFNEHPPLPYDVSSRKNSELSNLDLLTGERVSTVTGISAHQGKYWGIQGILSQVRAFRQHTRDNEANRPGQSSRGATTGDFLGNKLQVDSSDSATRSEYDEYRDKYRMFDRALFCLSPDNWLRRFCSVVLTKQLQPPSKTPVWDHVAPRTLFNGFFYLLRSVFSVLPYFTWFMLLVTVLALSGQIRETVEKKGTTFDRSSEFLSYLFWVDLIFVVFTLAELLMKIIANGVFLNPHAAIQGLWDVLDWLMVLATLGVLITYLVGCKQVMMELPITFRNMPWWLRILHTFRAFRPLRLISLVSSMRHVLYELALGFKKFFLALVLLLLFMFMFSSLGVQLFTGEKGMERFCNDPTKTTECECIGEFEIAVVTTSQEPLAIGNVTMDTFMTVPRIWYKYRRNFRFDNTFTAFITLFEVLTLEGWLDVRDLYKSMETSVFDNSRYTFFMFVYIHIFVFIGVNFGLQIFVGIVVNNFNEHKPDHSALLTVFQKRWTELLQRISLTRPIKEPPPPRNNKFRMNIYKFFSSRRYKHFSTFVILVNSFLYCMPWRDNDAIGEGYTKILVAVSTVLTTLFFIEFLMKLLAFGVRGYFQSGRNAFDFLLSVLGVAYVLVAITYLTENTPCIESVVDVGLSFTIMKLFTILMKYGIMQNLLRTVISTVLRGRHLVGVLLSILLLYTFMGHLYFSNVRTGEAINFSFVTFNRFFSSLNLMIRVVTGEDWYTIFQDSMVRYPYCSNDLGTCGFVVFAFLFYLSFYVLVSFILLNVVIAVLLENFSIFYNEDDTNLTHAVVMDFQHNWVFYDKNASGLISSNNIKLFLRMLRLNEFYTYGPKINGIKERQKSSVLGDSILLREMAEELCRDQRQQHAGQAETVSSGNTQEDKEHSFPFQDVLKMIAYRAEDISQSLVPHELYVREEFENSVQFDVAEQCILKWIKKYVQPVIKQQERTRRKTVSHNVHPGRHGRETLWPPLVTTTRADDETAGDGMFDSSEDSDNDFDPMNEFHSNSMRKRNTFMSSRSEEDGGSHSEGPHTAALHHQESMSANAAEAKVPALAKSWQRLESAQYFHFKPPQQQQQQGGAGQTQDKWHEWFQMQKDWMNNVEEDPDNYFDDNL